MIYYEATLGSMTVSLTEQKDGTLLLDGSESIFSKDGVPLNDWAIRKCGLLSDVKRIEVKLML